MTRSRRTKQRGIPKCHCRLLCGVTALLFTTCRQGSGFLVFGRAGGLSGCRPARLHTSRHHIYLSGLSVSCQQWEEKFFSSSSFLFLKVQYPGSGQTERKTPKRMRRREWRQAVSPASKSRLGKLGGCACSCLSRLQLAQENLLSCL